VKLFTRLALAGVATATIVAGLSACGGLPVNTNVIPGSAPTTAVVATESLAQQEQDWLGSCGDDMLTAWGTADTDLDLSVFAPGSSDGAVWTNCISSNPDSEMKGDLQSALAANVALASDYQEGDYAAVVEEAGSAKAYIQEATNRANQIKAGGDGNGG
jgi:hypothetical protein